MLEILFLAQDENGEMIMPKLLSFPFRVGVDLSLRMTKEKLQMTNCNV